MRLASLLAFGFLVGLIVLIYDMKYETRRLEAQAQELERAIAEERDNIALMRAEWSHVTRPERIEKLARAILEMEPAKPEQLITHRDFTDVLAGRPAPEEQDGGGWQARDEIGALIRQTGGSGDADSSAAQ